jgi:hypothetical protein
LPHKKEESRGILVYVTLLARKYSAEVEEDGSKMGFVVLFFV